MTLPLRAIYPLSVLIGVAAALWVMPLAAILGAGPGWDNPVPDQAQTLAGHLAFQADAWRWPLLSTMRLFWPQGVSVALTDSNPLASLLAKLWVTATGHPPVNLLGAWLGACWVMQAVAAAYAARGLCLPALPCLSAAALATCWPALLARMGHINLCGHFLLLLALGLALRRPDRRAWWAAAAAVLLTAALVQPYLFQLAGFVLASAALQALLERRPGWWRTGAGLMLLGAAAVGTLRLLAGPLGGGDKGFVFFSMNMLSPVWPQRSGVFGADLPVLDATGGQYEGLNWLGAGVMLLALPALLGWWRTPPAWRGARGLLLVLAGLAILSLSSRVYAGSLLLLDLGTKPWEDIFGTFRAPGRAFWPVGYALMLAAVAGVARLATPVLPRRVTLASPQYATAALLLVAVALQTIDAGPLRTGARTVWVQGSGIPATSVPPGAALFGVAPYPGCVRDPQVKAEGPLMLLQAVRQGAEVRDIGVGRPPPWFNCEKVMADRLEEPLLPREARAFLGEARAKLRPGWLGADTCRTLPRAVLCSRGVPLTEGTPLSIDVPMPLALPLALAGPALAAILGDGWQPGTDGAWWTEASRGTLLLALPPGQPGTPVLVLHAAAVSRRPGEARTVLAEAGSLSQRFELPDGDAATVTLRLPPTPGGLLRVVLDGGRATDPALRGLAAPVRRAAIRLLSVELRME